MKRLGLAVTVLGIIWASAVPAQTTPEECAKIENNDQRLSCYDMQFKSDSTARPSTGNWNTRIDKNPLNDSTTVILVNPASEGKARLGKRISLLLRCKNNKTEVFVSWNDYLGSDGAKVTHRVGDAEAKTRTWSQSTDNTATFYPGNDITLIKSMFGESKFVAQVTPYNESPSTAVFEISGLDKAIKPLREECGW